MRRFLFACVLIVVYALPAYAEAGTCNLALAESLKKTAVSIKMPLGEQAAIGTAWFISKNRLVTIKHVTDAGKLSRRFQEVTLRWSDTVDRKWNHELHTEARIVEVVHTGMAEPLIILEIKNPVSWAEVVHIRKIPVRKNEGVVAIGYQGGVVLIYGVGQVTSPGSWSISIYMTDGKGKKRAFQPGTSGGPIFDCNGHVVAATMSVHTWGRATNGAVGASAVLYYAVPKP